MRCTCDHTRTNSDKTEFLGVDIVKKTPGSGTAHGSQICIDDDVNRSNGQVGGTSAVECEPSKPDETCSEGEHKGIMRTEMVNTMLCCYAFAVRMLSLSQHE